VDPDDLRRMTLQIRLFRSERKITHILNSTDSLLKTVHSHFFDLVTIQEEGLSTSFEALLLPIMKQNIKVLLITSNDRVIKR
jgi:hypothetical protein